MKEQHTIKAATCEESGVLGLVLGTTNAANFAEGDLFVMADAIGIAHDLTEHVNGLENIGSVFDEFQALGAIWYTRGQFADLRRDSVGSALRTEEHLSGDLVRMASIAHYNGLGGHLDGDAVSVDVCPAIDALREVCDLARPDIREEMADCEEFRAADLDDYLAQALRGMVAGWNKQCARYTATEANSRFWNIAYALEPAFDALEYDGQEWRLDIDSSGDATLTELTWCADCEVSATYDELDSDMRCEDCHQPEKVTCGNCGKSWDESRDPAPSALCHWCHGRGESTHPLN